MKDGLLLGMALGFIVGAIVVTNSAKAEAIVQKGKKAIKKQVEKLINKIDVENKFDEINSKIDYDKYVKVCSIVN